MEFKHYLLSILDLLLIVVCLVYCHELKTYSDKVKDECDKKVECLTECINEERQYMLDIQKEQKHEIELNKIYVESVVDNLLNKEW